MSDSLPLEILREILYRLPVESLVRCTCVCKEWLSLITSPHFISTHLSHSLSHPGRRLLLRHSTESPVAQLFSFHLDSINIHQNVIFRSPFKSNYNLFFRIVGCLHGILCLSDDIFGMNGVIILWNPLIKRYVLLPPPRVNFDLVGPYMFVLGFGFDSNASDYKVVRVAYVQGRGYGSPDDVLPPRVELYSLKNGSWREINAAGVEYCICEREWSQVFMNGCVHWVAYGTKRCAVYNIILLFDVSEEKFKKMKLPESLVNLCPLTLLTAEISGWLGVLEYAYSGQENRICNVWVRKEYGLADSWTKMYCVSVDAGVELVLGLRPNGEFLVATKKGKLISYDPRNQESFDLGIEGIQEAFYAHFYTESLVLLDKQSRAASYGGAKNDAKEKKQKNKGSADSALLKEEDQSSILVSGGDHNENESTRSARSLVNMFKAIHIGFQMEKLRRIATLDVYN